MRVHHVGYLVKHLDRALAGFLALGYEMVSPMVEDEARRISICFIEKDGYRIELVSPLDATSVVADLVKRFRNAPYHICYVSDRFMEDVADLCAHGYVQLDEPAGAPALGGVRVVFLMGRSVGMIEVVEELGA